jgi:hypothetical protein
MPQTADAVCSEISGTEFAHGTCSAAGWFCDVIQSIWLPSLTPEMLVTQENSCSQSYANKQELFICMKTLHSCLGQWLAEIYKIFRTFL